MKSSSDLWNVAPHDSMPISSEKIRQGQSPPQGMNDTANHEDILWNQTWPGSRPGFTPYCVASFKVLKFSEKKISFPKL